MLGRTTSTNEMIEKILHAQLHRGQACGLIPCVVVCVNFREYMYVWAFLSTFFI